jgi:hypothetical protein
MTTFDANSFTQICAFGLLRYRSTESFASFFAGVRRIDSNPHISVFIGDRQSGQELGIKAVFEDAYVFFCWKHILDNLRMHFGARSPVVVLIEPLIWNMTLVPRSVDTLCHTVG